MIDWQGTSDKFRVCRVGREEVFECRDFMFRFGLWDWRENYCSQFCVWQLLCVRFTLYSARTPITGSVKETGMMYPWSWELNLVYRSFIIGGKQKFTIFQAWIECILKVRKFCVIKWELVLVPVNTNCNNSVEWVCQGQCTGVNFGCLCKVTCKLL